MRHPLHMDKLGTEVCIRPSRLSGLLRVGSSPSECLWKAGGDHGDERGEPKLLPFIREEPSLVSYLLLIGSTHSNRTEWQRVVAKGGVTKKTASLSLLPNLG